MRQVPAQHARPIGIVGDGRVARHFAHYFALLGLPVRTWSRRASSADPPSVLAPCGTVLLLIQDAAIAPFIKAWPRLRDRRLVHCAGGLTTDAAEAAHPLMTFGFDLYNLETYRAIPFVLDAGGTSFDRLLPGLPNPSFTIPGAERPYYHALCVLAGNFSTVLWSKLFDELRHRYGMPAAAAHPYLLRMTANLVNNAPGALTGPLSRHDTSTLAADLRALDGDPFHAVYQAFVRAYEERS